MQSSSFSLGDRAEGRSEGRCQAGVGLAASAGAPESPGHAFRGLLISKKRRSAMARRLFVLLILGFSLSFSLPEEPKGRSRYVPGRRLKGKRRGGKPYDPAQAAKTRRNIGGLLLLLGTAGMLSESSTEIYDFEPLPKLLFNAKNM